jgi:pyruvate formate lyase activating enzyme
VEITTLIVLGKNDSAEEMDALASFLASVSPDIPLHLTRYFPRWHEKTPATPI